MSINRVNISGHLTRDPELRMTPKGTQVLSFGIAVNDRRLNRETNQWEDYPNFVECTMFGTRAEAVGRIVRKGMKVSIDGKLRFNQWETKDGQKRSRLTVVVDTIDFMSQGNQSQNASANRPATPAQQVPVVPDVPAVMDVYLDITVHRVHFSGLALTIAKTNGFTTVLVNYKLHRTIVLCYNNRY